MQINRFILFLNFLLFSLLSAAQIYNPVEWTFKSKSLGGNKFELQYLANIAPTWHMYSQHLPSGDGPVATVFRLNTGKDYVALSDVKEPNPHKEYDPNFDMELSFFEGKVIFRQQVELKANAKVTGELEYMVCDASKCLPPEMVPFEFDLKLPNAPSAPVQPDVAAGQADHTATGSSDVSGTGILEPVKWSFGIEKISDSLLRLVARARIDSGWHIYSASPGMEDGPVGTLLSLDLSDGVQAVDAVEEIGNLNTTFDPGFDATLNYYEHEVAWMQKLRPGKSGKISGTITFMVCDNEKCLPPETVDFSVDAPVSLAVVDEKPVENSGIGAWLGILVAGFLGGMLALLTPCVFPMIPMTVSFFTKQSKTKAQGITNALIYAFSIVFIYVAMGFGITMIFGADALNALSTNVWFNLAFFVLLLVFAISFFGAFEITLPSSWINKADSAADKGGLIGIFFMAFVLSLVSFSCTGPIIGTLLVEAAVYGGVAGPIAGMVGFSLALALPFGLFAAFPGWLNSLPQSGGWLNSVKVSLGFIELALALKFLSNADLVVQAGLLKRELFIAIWIGIFLLLTGYLLGLFKLSHDSDLKHVSVPRLMFAILSFVFTIYLIPGLWGAPLKLISGFPPPMFYSESPNGVGGAVQKAVSSSENVNIPKGADPEHCPHNINCFHDYEEGMAYARSVGKPVMLDFTGWACVNCRKMEEQVWSDTRVLERLKNEVVLISLYVDEKLELPATEQIEVEIGGRKKKLKTVGNKWSYMQATRYNTNSQPYYLILDHQENPLTPPAAYDPDVEKYIGWLDGGIAAFRSKKK